MWVFARPVAAWFSAQEDTIRLAVIYLSIVPVSYVGFGASGLIGSALNGIGRGHWYLVANLVRVVLMLLFAVYGAHAYGFYGFAFGVGASNLLAGAVISVWSRRVFLAGKGI
jgi:Na+-driven multidrug efflux pump